MVEELRRRPDTVRGWLAKERDLYGLDDHKPLDKTPVLDDTVVDVIRG